MRRFDRTPRPGQRGFALFVVTIIVALVAIMAVSLLDQVGLDVIMAGEHRKMGMARANSIGGMTEVLSDATLLPNLPNTTDPTLTYRYIDYDGANYRRDPDGINTVVTEGESAYFSDMGTPVEQAYRSSARLLRLGPQMDTGVNRGQALVYEVWTESSINRADVTSQVRTEVWRTISVQQGRLINPAMAR